MRLLGIDPAILVLLTFLLGITLGRFWGKLRYRERLAEQVRKYRSSSSYVLGISNLIAGDRDLAMSELARAAKTDTDRIELYIILGNLYREKGRLERAIQIHRSVLHRKDLGKIDREMAQLALGIDFMRAGLVGRAKESFQDILVENPEHVETLKHLQRCYEDERNWEKAFEIRQNIMRITRSNDYSISAFIVAEWGVDIFREGDFDRALQIFQRAIDIFDEVYPAYEFMGKTYMAKEQLRKAADSWEEMIRLIPEKSFLVLRELYEVYTKLGAEEQIFEQCDFILFKNPQDWRVYMFLAEVYHTRKEYKEAMDNLMEALKINSSAMAIHQNLWKMFIKGGLEIKDIKKYVKLTEANFFNDPFVCVRCQYRISEFKRRCPHCRSWDTFVEEKI